MATDLEAIQGYAFLTVSDMPGFIDGGGMIQFVVRPKADPV